ncbi:hypothetical protein NG799_01720 [Laspinema sp. D1]|uniref:Uncharacterized protein n=2 Tax=Laspinema TaxID=2584823 RepID=A0ABT2MJX5_9CYAN|nr:MULTISPECIES: hypothetical protein [unclassified Laspinema]MCT7965049.1 hypothetical protein [Laspinema sp. D2a]MCT7977664.1 hypothetical protein [Laspinema sp. D3b]MCT7992509.1 hypothetical protein [Laspinema sp. D3c]
MNRTINFNGIRGEILESSPHGNYLVVALTDNVSVCVTKSNQFNWEESEDTKPFKAFVTYIGCQNHDQAELIKQWAIEQGVDFDTAKCEDEPRPSKRIRDTAKYPLELKIRGLSAQNVYAFVN